MARKAHIRLTTKLAAALLQIRDGQGERLIPHEHAKQMTDEQVISLFNFDHDPIPEAIGGPTIGWNLTPRLILDHRQKTAKIDIPQIRKGDRISAEHESFRKRMLAKAGVGEIPDGNIITQTPRKSGRSFPSGNRKLLSRPFPKRRTPTP